MTTWYHAFMLLDFSVCVEGIVAGKATLSLWLIFGIPE